MGGPLAVVVSANGAGIQLNVHIDKEMAKPMNKRAASRHRLLKAGAIEFGGGAIDCVVRNWSETGAALDVASPVGIPDRFTLALVADGTLQPCQVVWRKPNRIGVRFE